MLFRYRSRNTETQSRSSDVAYRICGIAAPWHYGPVALRPRGIAAPWHYGPVVLRPRGIMAPWHCGPVVLRPRGIMAPWHYGPVALWPRGIAACTRSHQYAITVLCQTFLCEYLSATAMLRSTAVCVDVMPMSCGCCAHSQLCVVTPRRLHCWTVRETGYVHTNTDGRRRTFFRPSVAVVAFIPTRTAPDGRKKMARTKKQKLMLWWWWRRRVNKVHSIRRFSVHPVNRSRHVHGEYHHLIPVLLDDPFKFAEYLRMNPDTFQDLLRRVAYACLKARKARCLRNTEGRAMQRKQG